MTMAVRAALTFDTEDPDRPNAGGTERLLDVLGAAGVRATFFLQGRWVDAEPSVARSVVERGHLVASHGFDHAPMSSLTDDAIRHDIARAEIAIRESAGVDPRPWFRCPFGDGASDPRVLGGLAAAGYRHVGWDVDSEDWRERSTAEELEACVRDGVRGAGDGAIVLLHNWPGVTPIALARVLAAAAGDGVTYVGIDELGRPPISTIPLA